MGLLDDAIREHLELKRQRGASDEELRRAEREALGPARRAGADAEGLGPPPIEEVAGSPLAPVPDPPPEDAPPPDRATAIRTTLPDPDEVPEPGRFEPPPPPVDEPVYADEYAAEPAPSDADDDYLALDEPPVEADFPGTPKPHGDPALGDREEHVVSPEEPAGGPSPEPHGDPADELEFEPDEVPADEQLGGPPDPDRVRTSILDDPLEQMGPPPAEEPPPGGEQDVLEETPDFLQETPEHDKLWFEQKPPRDFDFE